MSDRYDEEDEPSGNEDDPRFVDYGDAYDEDDKIFEPFDY